MAFPLISGGIYGYPKEEAITVAVEAIRSFLTTEDDSDMEVQLVLYGSGAYAAGTQLYGEIASYIREHEVRPDSRLAGRNGTGLRLEQFNPPPSDPELSESFHAPARGLPFDEAAAEAPEGPARYSACTVREDAAEAPSVDADILYAPKPSHSLMPKPTPSPLRPSLSQDETERQLRRYMNSLPQAESFGVYLLKLIDSKGMKDSDVYHNANMDKRLFSKLHSVPGYRPKKETVFALCVSLRLNVDEARALLAKAGYAFSDASPLDLAVFWYLEHGSWDLFALNLVLAEMHLPQLGSGMRGD